METVYDICVVGCGGTGGNLIKELGRFLKFFAVPEKTWYLSLIDGDRVEEKNGSRQPFLAQDVQQMKALVMREGLVECLGLPGDNVYAYPSYITNVSQLQKWNASHDSYGYCTKIKVLVGCVDNHRARQVMHEYYSQCRDIVYVDAANEYDSGEVVIGVRLKGKELCPPRAFYFPEVLTDMGKTAVEESCGVVNISSPQHIVTNLCAAQHALSVIVRLLQDNVVEGGIIHFNAFTHFSRFDRWEEVEQSKQNTVNRKRRKKVAADEAK